MYDYCRLCGSDSPAALQNVPSCLATNLPFAVDGANPCACESYWADEPYIKTILLGKKPGWCQT